MYMYFFLHGTVCNLFPYPLSPFFTTFVSDRIATSFGLANIC